MKKRILIPAVILTCIALTASFADLSAAKQPTQTTDGIIRLHVRAENDTPAEQALKLEVRDAILGQTETLLRNCTDAEEAKSILSQNLDTLSEAGKNAVSNAGFSHKVTVALKRELFEYREYDGFFLPAGEYDSLIVTVGSGEGKNWWCVVFPAACYTGAGGQIESDAERMPECFRLAKGPVEEPKIRWGIWEWIKRWFD